MVIVTNCSVSHQSALGTIDSKALRSPTPTGCQISNMPKVKGVRRIIDWRTKEA
jgi:hypothetical protein